jgi:hypothetical protein
VSRKQILNFCHALPKFLTCGKAEIAWKKRFCAPVPGIHIPPNKLTSSACLLLDFFDLPTEKLKGSGDRTHYFWLFLIGSPWNKCLPILLYCSILLHVLLIHNVVLQHPVARLTIHNIVLQHPVTRVTIHNIVLQHPVTRVTIHNIVLQHPVTRVTIHNNVLQHPGTCVTIQNVVLQHPVAR